MDDSIVPMRSVVLLMGACAAIGIAASCSSFEEVDPSGAPDSSAPETEAGPIETDGGNPIDAGELGSCAPLARSVGYFAHFPAAEGAEVYALAVEPQGSVWMSGFAADVDFG